MASVDLDIANTIAAAVGSLTVGVNLFTGPLPEVGDGIPALCVAVHTWGGDPPTVYKDGGVGTNLNAHATQVFVRSQAEDYDSGKTIADAAYNAVRKSTPANTIGTEADQSAALYLGEDDNRRHLWSINITTYKNE
jgi:hypothetical protein